MNTASKHITETVRRSTNERTKFYNQWVMIMLIVTNLINALPGNSSVNKAQHTKMEEALFL
jgi:hypothetical protein